MLRAQRKDEGEDQYDLSIRQHPWNLLSFSIVLQQHWKANFNERRNYALWSRMLSLSERLLQPSERFELISRSQKETNHKKATNASVECTYKHPKCKILLFKEVLKHHLAFFSNSKIYQTSYCRMDLASKTNKCLLLCINRKSTNEFHSFPTVTAVLSPNWICNGEEVSVKSTQNEYSRLNRRRKRVKDSVANMGETVQRHISGWMLVYYGL